MKSTVDWITMIKDFLVNFIKTYAGEFVDDINENNLSYSLLLGQMFYLYTFYNV